MLFRTIELVGVSRRDKQIRSVFVEFISCGSDFGLEQLRKSPVEPNGDSGEVPPHALRHPNLMSQPVGRHLCGYDPAVPDPRVFVRCLPEAVARQSCEIPVSRQQPTTLAAASRTRADAVASESLRQRTNHSTEKGLGSKSKFVGRLKLNLSVPGFETGSEVLF